MKPPYDRNPTERKPKRRPYQIMGFLETTRYYFGWKRYRRRAIQENKNYKTLDEYMGEIHRD